MFGLLVLRGSVALRPLQRGQASSMLCSLQNSVTAAEFSVEPASLHAKLVDAVTMSVVEVDNVTEGFDECFGGLVFGHDPVAITGADVLEDEPTGKTSHRYGGDFALIVNGDDLAGVVGFDA